MKTVMVLLTLAACAARAQEVPATHLTLEEAISLALDNHASLRSAGAALHISEALARQARAAFFPSLNAVASDSHVEGAFVFNPSIQPRDQIYSTYAVSLQGQMMLFDFGKTLHRVEAGNRGVQASEEDVRATRDQVVMNVQIAYYGEMQAQKIDRVNQEAVDQAEQHLKQAKAFYSVGRRPQFDVTKAEVDLANANVTLIRGRNQLRLARLQLDNAIGVHPRQEYQVEDRFTIPPFPIPLDSLKRLALEKRPEILSARAHLEADQALIGAAFSQHFPTISATGNYTWSAFGFPLFGRWTAALSFNLPLFQGFAIDAQVDQARALASADQASLDLLTENVLLDVEQNYYALQEATERIAASTRLIEQAEENLTLAERQYAAGVGTPIEVADAQLARSNAFITNIQAQYDYHVALAQLRRAAGIVWF
jgi:outer membrane protein